VEKNINPAHPTSEPPECLKDMFFFHGFSATQPAEAADCAREVGQKLKLHELLRQKKQGTQMCKRVQ
jgi:hypothetical protein